MGGGKCPDCFGTGTNLSLVSAEANCLKCLGTGNCQQCGGTGGIVIRPEEWLLRKLEVLEKNLKEWEPEEWLERKRQSLQQKIKVWK